MKKVIWRTAAATAAVGTLVAVVAFLPTGASAAPGDAFSSAYGVRVQALNGAVNVGPLPVSTFPPGANNTALSVRLGPLGGTGALTANTSGDASGNSAATGSAANVALLTPVLLPGFPAVAATLISASCTANGATLAGSSTFTAATITGVAAVAVNPAPNSVVINAAGLTVTLNEQTTVGGVLTVNALHIRLVVATVVVADVIIGHVTCGPNVPVAAVDAFSFQNLPLVLGGLAIIAMIGFGLRTGTRRLRGLA